MSKAHARPHGSKPAHGRFWPAFLRGLVVTAIVVWLNHLLEARPAGQWLLRRTYDFLQYRLRIDPTPHHGQPPALPIVVVDIQDVPGPEAAPDNWHAVTHRGHLQSIVTALSELGPNRPRALAVDIDCSPLAVADDHGRLVPKWTDEAAERAFIQQSLTLTQSGLPIFLAVGQGIALPRSEWLGSEAAAALAAHPYCPRVPDELEPPAHGHDTSPDPRKMPGTLEFKEDRSLIPSLAESLQASAGRAERQVPVALRWAVELASQFKPEEGTEHFTGPGHDSAPAAHDGTHADAENHAAPAHAAPPVMPSRRFSTTLFAVNYGALESFRRGAIRALNDDDITQNAAAFRDKLVIIGNCNPSRHDLHPVPDREREVAGVFIHACAAWTLLDAPIYSLTHAGRIAIDFLLASVLLVFVLKGGTWLSRLGLPVSHDALHRWVPRIVCGAALLLGVGFIRLTRLMWDDFVFVSLGLLFFHGWLEHGAEIIWDWTRRCGQVFSRHRKPHTS
jgi:CHASE2 domain-containing sensor protein